MEIRDVCFLTKKFKMLFFRICDFWPMKNKENLIFAKKQKLLIIKFFRLQTEFHKNLSKWR